jgi:hypothetical protein
MEFDNFDVQMGAKGLLGNTRSLTFQELVRFPLRLLPLRAAVAD